ncbi:MAG: sigma-70 family RNA polymerase sigma factor [Bacillota bacterium]|nr:sigma-70 family RNA polymerase sigma factor [Bacillota bacterium]MDO4859514.1 sigma-70 family RNA polymerase sigma factor [Bacillota bacterium]
MTEKDLFLEYRKTKDPSLRNKIVEDHMYMVDILISKYRNKGVEYDDLYQVASLALISAVDRFDPEKGYEFSSFATPTILGDIKKHFRDKAWSMKVPRRIKEMSGKLPKVKEKLTAQLGRVPNVDELAEAMGSDRAEILEVIEGGRAFYTMSLDQKFADWGEDSESPAFEKYTADREKGYDRLEYEEMIEKVLDELSDTNMYIFRKRFLENRSQAEIAEDLGVSQMTISRAERNIKARFAKELERSS